MFLQGKRELFPINDYNPPIGYYEVKRQSGSRQVDFGRKPINKAKKEQERNSPGPGAYSNEPKQSLPSIIGKDQLGAYARPKDRLLLQKKFNFRATTLHTKKNAAPNVYSYNPQLTYVKPNIQSLVRYRKAKKISTGIIQDDFLPFEEVLAGRQISMVPVAQGEQDEESVEKIEYSDYKEDLRERVKQQRVKKSRNFSYYVALDNLEQLILRDRFRAEVLNPGPGAYNLDSSSDNGKKQQQCSFAKDKRFHYPSPSQVSAASYDNQSFFREPRRSQVNYEKMADYSRESPVQKTPGVGEYDLRVNRSFQIQRNIEFPAVFGSGQKRF